MKLKFRHKILLFLVIISAVFTSFACRILFHTDGNRNRIHGCNAKILKFFAWKLSVNFKINSTHSLTHFVPRST
jgi:hypothetical protein